MVAQVAKHLLSMHEASGSSLARDKFLKDWDVGQDVDHKASSLAGIQGFWELHFFLVFVLSLAELPH